ncbi:MAG: hypothetical protein ACUVTD_02490 [Nitrososphaerales archaeon]
MNITIRIMGDKELAKEIAKRFEQLLNVSFREYPMYKDERNRTEIDESKIRLYASYSRNASLQRRTIPKIEEISQKMRPSASN